VGVGSADPSSLAATMSTRAIPRGEEAAGLEVSTPPKGTHFHHDEADLQEPDVQASW
jgi:hypothetical protein